MSQIVPTLILAALVLVGLGGRSPAQDIGDARRGLTVAQMTCARCHVIGKEQIRLRNRRAPNFEALANTPGMTPMAIRVTLRTSHREMPNLVLKNDEIDDIIAYIETLK